MKILIFLLINFSVFVCNGTQSAGLPSKTIDGKKYLVYTVNKGDSWFGIAQKFGIKYSELRLSNKDSGTNLNIGALVLIPTTPLKSNDPFFEKNYIDSGITQNNDSFNYHIVAPSQTLYGISKIYNVSIDELKKWNSLSESGIKPGQKLIVGKKVSSVKPVEENNQSQIPASDSGPTDSEKRKNRMRHIVVPVPEDEPGMDPSGACIPGASSVAVPPREFEDETDSSFSVEKANAENPVEDKVVFGNGRQEVNEEGLAITSEEEDQGSEKYFAFHRSAPVGTIIKVMNTANSNKVYVKVIGTIPDIPENEDAIIKISKTSAKRLDNIQNKFHVRLQYGIDK